MSAFRRLVAAVAVVWLVACGGAADVAEGEHAPVEVRTAIDGSVTARGGRFEVVVDQEADLDVTWPEIGPTRLEVEPDGEVRTERVGDRVVRTRQYIFTGAKGSHVIPAVYVTYTAADGSQAMASSQPLYVDLGVPPPRPGELADIADPEPDRPFPWGWALTVLAVVALFVGGLAVAFRGGQDKALAAVPPEPPDVIALRAWEAVRAAEDLSDYDKALSISRIFREYAEAVLAFKATALTTTEILERLRHMLHLEEGNVPRAKRLLRATDRIKFAEVAAKSDLFEELDADLRAFVASTRPHHWEPDEGEVRVVRERTRIQWPWWMLLVNRIYAGGFAGGAVAVGWTLYSQMQAGGLPLQPFVITLVVISVFLVLMGLFGVLGLEVLATRLKWVQALVAVGALIFVPIGTVYGVFVLFVLFGTPTGKDFYQRGAA